MKTRGVVGFARVNISADLRAISEGEHFRNVKAYLGNISATSRGGQGLRFYGKS